MFANILAAALRNLARNRLYAAIGIGGLAIGLAAAILTGLYIRDELSFDSFMPGHDQAYVVIWEIDLPGRPPIVEEWSMTYLARLFKSDYPEVQAAGRLYASGDPVGVRRGDIEGLERVGWADPDLFRILRLPAVAGDPAAALARPDGVVITRALARRYFGEDAPVGRLLQIDRAMTLRVGAVVRDLPSTSHLGTLQIFASNLNPASPLAVFDRRPVERGQLSVDARTYLRLPNPAVARRLNADMPDFIRRHIAMADGKLPLGITGSLRLIPLKDLHLYPLKGTVLANLSSHGDASALVALSLIAGLVLAVAAVNFVNLMTGRAARRAVEVGMRKAAGARRTDLVIQFMGEAMIHVTLALVLALAVLELVLPFLRSVVDRPLALDYWREPGLLGVTVGLALLVGAPAGIYPALVLSGFHPATVLKGTAPSTAGSAAVRAGLTALQFAVLIGLILALTVIGLQTRYALNEGLNLDKARMLTFDISRPHPGRSPSGPPPRLCREAFVDEVRRISGVTGAACSGQTALDIGDPEWIVDIPSGTTSINVAVVDHGFLELYGLRPLAGRFFSSAHPEDETPLVADLTIADPKPRTAVINETAARALGYARPADAVGHTFRQHLDRADTQIIGVVRDFAFDLNHGGVRPTLYVLYTPVLDTLSIKLSGDGTPAVLKAIDDRWKASGAVRPPRRRFVDDYLRTLYAATIDQGRLLAGLGVLAVTLAGLGLFALAAFTAERRTREIGVRKAMGASNADVTALLLWSFARPVLLANLIAWPLAGWSLQRWLQGFARHIALQPWMFLAAALAALAVALATVLSHTLRVASAKPVSALRYE